VEPRAIRFARRDREGESAAGGGILSGGNYPSRTLLGVIGGAILLLLLLLFALNQIGNDNGDDALTPTSTVESVFDRNNGLEGPDAEAPATPGNGDTTEPGNNAAATEDDVTEPASEETPEATRPDDRPRPGGDNQLDSPDGATETPDASVDDLRAGEPQPHGF
jgi:hypothetical protein